MEIWRRSNEALHTNSADDMDMDLSQDGASPSSVEKLSSLSELGAHQDVDNHNNNNNNNLSDIEDDIKKTCPHCTFDNRSLARLCEMCEHDLGAVSIAHDV